jgi:hypothetical protein
MKIGLIVESTSDGAEIKVLPHLLRMLDSSLLEEDIRVVAMTNKVDSKHAIWIAQKLPDLQRLKKLETFKRFALKAVGKVL